MKQVFLIFITLFCLAQEAISQTYFRFTEKASEVYTASFQLDFQTAEKMLSQFKKDDSENLIRIFPGKPIRLL